jgi:hypothetical protein
VRQVLLKSAQRKGAASVGVLMRRFGAPLQAKQVGLSRIEIKGQQL